MHEYKPVAQASPDALGLIVQNIFDACIVFDTGGRILYWNEEAERQFGWQSGEVAGESIFEVLMPLPIRGKYLTGLRRDLVQGGSEFLNRAIRLRVTHKTGQPLDLELMTIPVPIAASTVLFAFFHDRFKNRRMEREITHRRHQLATALAAADLGVVEWNPVTNRMWKNAKDVVLHTGNVHARIETIEDFLRWVHPDDQPKIRDTLQAALSDGTLQQVEYRVIWQNGEVHWVSARGTVLRDRAGHPGHLFGVTWDVTAIKQAEAQLAVERARNEWILESISDGFFALDNQYRFVYINSRALQILNRPKEALMGQIIWEVFTDIRGGLFERKYREVKATGQATEFEVRYPPLNLWVNVHVYPSKEGLSVFFSDITERKQHEADLQQLSRQLQLAREEERKHIAREIHDELGSTLVALKMQINTSLAVCEQAHAFHDHEADALAERVDSAMQTVRRIIDDLRPSLLDTLGLWAALEWLTEQFQQSTGIRTIYQLTGPEIEVDAERALAIYRIVQEALNNVAKHAHATEVTVNIKTNTRIDVSIVDNGTGAQHQAPATACYGILGMKERAANFGGNVSVQAVQPRGTRVKARFPISRNKQQE